MKGMGILVMGSALIMVVFVIIMPFVQIFFQPVRGEITNIELRTEAYTMGNALAAAGVYMGSALRFSAYQAMHDTGMQGGWDAIPAGKSFQAGEGSYAIWHNGSDVSPSEDELKASLGKSVAAWLGKYREKGFRFLNDYSVRLPVYSPVLVSEFTGSSFSVSAMPDSRMSIQKGSQDGSTNVLLERTASLQDSFSYPYLELFREAKRINAEFGPMAGEEAGRILSAYPAKFEGPGGQSCEDIFTGMARTNYLGAEEEIRKKLQESNVLNSVPVSEKYATESLVVSAEVKVEEVFSARGQKTECEVQYARDIAVMVSVIDGDESRWVPVHEDGEPTMAPLKFSFVVKA